jgi:hypothetical protein
MPLMLKLQICMIGLLPVPALAASSTVMSLYQRITLCRTFADNAGIIWDNRHTNTVKIKERWPPMADGLWSQVQQLQSRIAQHIDSGKTTIRADAAQFAYNACRNQWPY